MGTKCLLIIKIKTKKNKIKKTERTIFYVLKYFVTIISSPNSFLLYVYSPKGMTSFTISFSMFGHCIIE